MKKANTMTMKGGNTDSVYKTKNRYNFAHSLKKQHPDVVRVVKKYGRWHHEVNYKPFETNKMVLKKGVSVPRKKNEFGMKVVKRKKHFMDT